MCVCVGTCSALMFNRANMRSTRTNALAYTHNAFHINTIIRNISKSLDWKKAKPQKKYDKTLKAKTPKDYAIPKWSLKWNDNRWFDIFFAQNWQQFAIVFHAFLFSSMEYQVFPLKYLLSPYWKLVIQDEYVCHGFSLNWMVERLNDRSDFLIPFDCDLICFAKVLLFWIAYMSPYIFWT